MPGRSHHEKHFTSSDVVRDVVLGMADGLTVPFALAAGLSGAVDSSKLIILAGLAEIVAGAIAMGLGGYLAARSEVEHYESEREREKREVIEMPAEEMAEVDTIFRSYGLTAEQSAPLVDALSKRPRAWVDFMMRYELGLEKPDPKRAVVSALTIALSYVVGGLIPLAPYFLLPVMHDALQASIGVTLTALLVFGYVKGRYTGSRPVRGALQTALVGGIAAGVAFAVARALS